MSAARRRVLAVVTPALVFLAAALFAPGPAEAKAKRSKERQLFAPWSVWNRVLPDDAPLDPSSDSLTSAFKLDIRRQIDGNYGPYIATRSYSTPIYRVPRDQPRVPVQLDSGPWGATLARKLARGVPIPDGASPAVGTDGHMTVWQPSTDTLWEFWRARLAPDGWHANWGGRMRDVSKSPGHYRDRIRRKRVIEQRNWGATASSLPVAAGVITRAEARRGRIDHALALNTPFPCRDIYTWPAQRTDGRGVFPNCLPEGARLRLDPGLDLDSLAMPPFTRMIAEAAQRYGMIVRDGTGEATGFFCESLRPGAFDIWNGVTGRDGLLGAPPWELVRDQFPWDHVQLLRMRLRQR